MAFIEEQTAVMRWFLGVCSTVILVIGALFVSGGTLAWFLPFLLVILAALIWRGRRGHARRVLGYLHHATRTGQPMLNVVEAASIDESPGTAKRLGVLVAGLRAGQPLSAAIERALPEISLRELNLIALGERTGRLSELLGRIDRSRQEQDMAEGREPGMPLGMRILVLGVSAFLFGFVGMGLVMFVLPALREIFSDFGLDPSAAVPGPQAAAWAVLTCILGLLAWAGLLSTLFIFTGSRVATGRWSACWSWFTDPLVWYVPFVGTAVRARALGDWCFGLRQGVDVGLPIDKAAADAGECCGNRVLAERTVQMTRMLEAGVDLAEAARRSRMPRMIHGMLASAKGGDQTVCTLAFLTDHYEARFGRIEALLRGAVIPALVLINGLFVGVLAIWMVQSVVALLTVVMKAAPQWGAL